MNDDFRFERLFEDGLHELAPRRAPDRLRTKVKAETSEMRPRARWLALIKEPPMRINSRTAAGSPTARVAAIMVATLLATLLVISAGVAGARLLAADGPIVVDQSGGGHYTTIGEAVAAAKDGDAILVKPGTYVEAVVVDKDITLRGDGPVEDIVITAPEDGPTWEVDFSYINTLPFALVVSEADATLSDLTLRGLPSRLLLDGGDTTAEGLYLDGVGEFYTGSNVAKTGGIVVNGDTTATLRRNTLRGGGEIDVYNYSNTIIEDNDLIDGPNIAGLFGPESVVSGNRITGTGFQGIVFLGGTEATFTDNVIEGRERAIGLGLGISTGPIHAPVIERNQVSGAANTAIELLTATGGRVVDNTVTDAEWGIRLGRSEILVSGNAVEGTTAGILVGGPATIEGNHVQGNITGIRVNSGASPTLTGNVVCDNETNLAVLGGATPILVDNEICEDGVAA